MIYIYLIGIFIAWYMIGFFSYIFTETEIYDNDADIGLAVMLGLGGILTMIIGIFFVLEKGCKSWKFLKSKSHRKREREEALRELGK